MPGDPVKPVTIHDALDQIKSKVSGASWDHADDMQKSLLANEIWWLAYNALETIDEPAWWVVLTDMGKVIFHGPDEEKARRVADKHGRSISPLYASPPDAGVGVKALDLSNLLKHAFISGRESVSGSSSHHVEAWVEYDPEQIAPYKRIIAALTTSPDASGLREADDWQPIETAPKDGTHILVAVDWLPYPTVLFWNVHPEMQCWECPASGVPLHVRRRGGWRPLFWRPCPGLPATLFSGSGMT